MNLSTGLSWLAEGMVRRKFEYKGVNCLGHLKSKLEMNEQLLTGSGELVVNVCRWVLFADVGRSRSDRGHSMTQRSCFQAIRERLSRMDSGKRVWRSCG